MKFKTPQGREKYKNITKNKVNWDGPSRSKFQKRVKDFFKEYWKYDVVFEEMPLVGTKLRADFANITKKIVVEVDGIQHNQFSPFFHGTLNNYRRHIERDLLKEKWIEVNGFLLIRIFPEEEKLLSRTWIRDKFDILL